MKTVKTLPEFAAISELEVNAALDAYDDSMEEEHSSCGGCDFWHMDYEEESRLKAERVKTCLNRMGGENLESLEILSAPTCYGYRNKAQYPVSSGKKGVFAGFLGVLISLIGEMKLDVRLGQKLAEVTEDGVICEDVKTGEKQSIPADTVLLAIGMKSRWAEADELRRACPETSSFLIGDCLYVGKNVMSATNGALNAAGYM